MLTPFIEDVDRRRKRFVLYSPGPGTDIIDQLATRNVTTEHRRLPPDGPEPFVAIYDDEEFAGNVMLEDLRELLAPPVVRPEDVDGLAEGYRALFDVLVGRHCSPRSTAASCWPPAGRSRTGRCASATGRSAPGSSGCRSSSHRSTPTGGSRPKPAS